MILLELQVFFQAVSSLAIAGGLIYNAVQFRSYRKAQNFANFTKLVQAQMHLREMRVADPSLARVYEHDMADPNNPRHIREYYFNLMQLSVFEIVWYGYTAGQVPHDYFRSWECRMREIVVEKTFQLMWNSPSMKIMHDDFQRYMTRMMQEVPHAPMSSPADTLASHAR